MTVNIKSPGLEGQTFEARLIIGGVPQPTVTITDYGVPQVAVELQALGGRINEYPDLVSLSAPELLRGQADGTATLNLRDVHEPTTLQGTDSEGRNVNINVSKMSSRNGWAMADYYMLETDTNGGLVIEPGENHRSIYVSGHASAWTRASIGAAQTPPIADTAVTGAWLLQNPIYGSTEAQKVDRHVALLIINAMHAAMGANDKLHPSWWLYAERGYDYTGLTIGSGQYGESPLHPRVITSFGTGADPTGIQYGGPNSGFPSNMVAIGVPLHMPTIRNFENFMLADATYNEEIGFSGEQGTGLSFYRTAHYDAHRAAPANGSTWTAHQDRISGVYFSATKGSLFWDTVWDHNGWEDGYRTDGVWNNGEFGQPASIYSHNVYTAQGQVDMSWHGLLSMRSASVAGQMRIGGWQMDCTSIDNQVAFQNSGNRWDDPSTDGNITGFLSINIRSAAISAQNLEYIGQTGGRRQGFDWQGVQTVDVDCIVMHAADPDNPAEIAAKGTAQAAVSRGRGGLWSNLVIRGWAGDLNLTGLVTSFIDTITIQRRAASLLGQPTATIADYANYLRGLTPRQRQLEIKAVNRYLLSAREPNLELPLDDRTVPALLTFKPDWRGEGFRSDSPINWSTKDTPINGDDLDLYGNYVKWVKDSRSVDDIRFRAGGKLVVSSGKLSANSHTDAANVEVMNCGKYHAPATTGDYIVREGGRLVLTGTATIGLEVSGQGQVILGPNCIIPSGKKARIANDMCKIGWDANTGTGALTIEEGGILEFHATPVIQYNGFAMTPWDHYTNDLLGQTSGATGKYDGGRRRSRNMYMRIRDLVGTPVVGELTNAGKFARPATGTIAAIHPATIGKIERFRSGRFGLTMPGVTATVTLEAGSEVVISNRDKLSPGTYDLGGGTGTGITYVNNGASLPAGVTVTGGKLTYTVPA